MKIAVVILNWNGAKLLSKFLPSVVAQSPTAVVVVADNGSTDDSVALLQRDFPAVQCIRMEQNYGFADGYNRTLQQVEADCYVLLNSDVEVTANWLTAPVEILASNPRVAAVQPKIRSFTHRNEFEYAGAAGGFIDRLGYPLCRGRVLDTVEGDCGQYDSDISVFWASGACMFVRASAFHEAGGFDAGFWAHMEEIDLCWRLKNRGYSIRYTPRSVVYHLGGATLAYNNPQKLFLNFRNSLFMLFKNLPRRALLLTLPLRMLLDGVAALQFLFGGNGRAFNAVIRAHAAFYRALPALWHTRRQLPKSRKRFPEMLNTSIIWQYYIRKRRTWPQ
ncbi:MAG: glycosyltransferase family 2 protein [Bacteroidales bacterium]|jgi:GT2 family glycosyltransferase|nr:glycosyltransferase family 2 protein [Bacteroidales bacterium]